LQKKNRCKKAFAVKSAYFIYDTAILSHYFKTSIPIFEF
jgi:hypothetical protein